MVEENIFIPKTDKLPDQSVLEISRFLLYFPTKATLGTGQENGRGNTD